jgi:hypothetical protein
MLYAALCGLGQAQARLSATSAVRTARSTSSTKPAAAKEVSWVRKPIADGIPRLDSVAQPPPIRSSAYTKMHTAVDGPQDRHFRILAAGNGNHIKAEWDPALAAGTNRATPTAT